MPSDKEPSHTGLIQLLHVCILLFAYLTTISVTEQASLMRQNLADISLAPVLYSMVYGHHDNLLFLGDSCSLADIDTLLMQGSNLANMSIEPVLYSMIYGHHHGHHHSHQVVTDHCSPTDIDTGLMQGSKLQ